MRMLSPDSALPAFQPPAQEARVPGGLALGGLAPGGLAGALWVGRPYADGPHDDAGCLPLPHRPEAGREARRTAQSQLERWRVPAESADDVLLVVSELVTNALNHALPSVCMHLTRLPCGIVRVEVADGGPCGEVLDRDPDAGGRGLALVEALAESHGRTEIPAGALAWAEVDTAVKPVDLAGRVPGARTLG